MKSLVAAVAALAVAALAGCSYVNPITTQEYYAASDGIHLAIDDVEAQNLIVFTTGADEPGVLTGTLVNRGTTDVSLLVSFDGETTNSVDVSAGTSVVMSPIDGVEVVGTVPVMPGQITTVGFANDSNGYFQHDAPVLDATLPQYAQIVDAIG